MDDTILPLPGQHPDRPLVRFTDVVKEYAGTSAAPVRALDGVTFDVAEGDFVVVVGPSGAGKTTLLNLLGGMDAATSGDIRVAGAVVSTFTPKQLTWYRRHLVGFVFQFYNLMPNLTALENVELATEIAPDPLAPADVLERVGLAGRAGSFPVQLSGGEQQRVSIARAVAKNPRLLLCDEPTGALDDLTGKSILRLLHDISSIEGKTVVVVTHNSALKPIADVVLTIRSGRLQSMERNATPTSVEEIDW